MPEGSAWPAESNALRACRSLVRFCAGDVESA
ncbi:MAG: hypothetical protein RLZZ461_1377, partial [Planctomycetota bacterium]